MPPSEDQAQHERREHHGQGENGRDNGNGKTPSLRDHTEREGGHVLDDAVKSLRTRWGRALHMHRILREDEREMEEFTRREIDSCIEAVRRDLVNTLGISDAAALKRVRNTRMLRDRDQLRETFAPHRQLHNRIREKLQSDEEQGMTKDDFYDHVRATESPVDDWILETYPDETNEILETEDDEERGKKCAELAKRIRRDIREGEVEVPERFGNIAGDKVSQYVFLLHAYGGFINARFAPLPREVVNGVFGHMPDEGTMEGIFQDRKKLRDLPDAQTSSLRVIVGGREVHAYGADAVLEQVRQIQRELPGARIVQVHQLKDEEVAVALRKLGEGMVVEGVARQDGSDIAIVGKEGDAVEVRGLQNVGQEEFLRHPMRYLSHEIRFVAEGDEEEEEWDEEDEAEGEQPGEAGQPSAART